MRASRSIAVAILLAASAASARDHKKQGDPADVSGEAATAQKASQGSLIPMIVVCATPGAGIFVDGEQIGYTPMDLPVPMTPGDHSIKVVKPGYAPYIDVFSTKNKREVKLEMELVPVSGVLHVKCNIPGARVIVDGRYVGDAPMDVEADVGPRSVQVSKGGYKDFFQNVMSVAGQEVPLDAHLEDLPDGLNPYKIAPPAPPRWYQKKWVWGVVAGVAVVAAGGVVAGVVVAGRDFLGDSDVRAPWIGQ